jgi:hypothetical protein
MTARVASSTNIASWHRFSPPTPLPGLEVSQLPVWPGSAERRAAGVAQ